MRQKIKSWLLAIITLLAVAPATQAQVTIGDKKAPETFSLLEITTANQKGGLRLPQLTTAQRNALNPSSNPTEAKGLVIYNTDNNCLEYWNLTKWVSLCTGNAEISFTTPGGNPTNPADRRDPTQPAFPSGGETRGPFTPHDNPECTTQTPPYTFVVMSGDAYTHITVTNETTSEFKVTMDENTSIKPRTAIVRVTNNCTGEYKEFLFSQLGLDESVVCDPSKTVPAISGYNGTDICNSGAAYLYLSGISQTATDIDNYIWTLDNREVGRGASYIATQSGTYCVYYKTIGCTQNSGSKVISAGTNGSTPAPNKIDILVAENDGYVCSESDKIKLVSNTSNLQAGEMVIWFKDGVRQAIFDGQSTILAGVGTWYCAVVNGSCSSVPSDSKTVQVDPNAGKGGTAISKPNVKVNGVALSSATLCKGGMVMFEVTNPQSGVNYTWKLDNTEIGQGTSISYLVPSTMTGSKVIRCSATPQLNDACRAEAFEEKSVSTGSIPTTPYITVNTKDALCGGSATLTANFTGTPTAYNWYKKDGTTFTFITTTGTNPNYVVTQAGEYAVGVMSGGCSSSISGSKNIVASDFGTISWTLQPTTANIGETKTFSVNVTPGYKAAYNWTVTGGTITNGQGTNTITVNFPTATTATVSVQAENACGNVSGTSSFNVTVSAACTPPTVTQTNAPSQPIKAGQTANMSVTATGTPALSYQWYTGAVGTTTNPIAGQIGSSYSPTLSSAGSYQYWCKVTNACGDANSAQITVTVDADPSKIDTGSGTLSGRTCFDIARSNDNQYNCGLLSGRAGNKADFTQTTVNTQTYTFTPSGTVSKVRFDYIESQSGVIVQSLTPANSGYSTQTNITGACTVTLVYKSSLNDDAYGLTSDNALKLDIYAIYNDNATGTGTDKAVKLTAQIKDCACCGAMTTSGQWLNFMCHNLGADETLDPFTYVVGNAAGSGGTLGWLYQWGRNTDGHQKRNSATRTGATNSPGSSFVLNTASPFDWRSTQSKTLWGDGTQNENMAKAANDPCPAGWKVPSIKQWQSIFSTNTANGQAPTAATANTWSWTGNGYKIGQTLYLPAAGCRSSITGSLNNVGPYGFYWSSTVNGTTSYALYFYSKVTPSGSSDRVTGYSLRCVQE